jgi:NAD(P)-dependent dehydrogenase (short-subunit alcohol dehydrogenase family)
LYGFDEGWRSSLAAPSGLGFAIATRLAQEGAAVVRVSDQDADLGK